ncbi:LpxL/LpxP family acyltransferase [Ramlibacter tataouinensis]|uniref:Acyl-CoA synthetase n=1 Tax=Ramlibacter tataouinensis (strain ATCC BAA-407 / DSM 14655 / LMG 21543 / TTB310) TaxID=365046 RepID=F5Y4K2_RAMTT|nr:acyl-CoA synthetase [Ramlibacter tataouinensis]AEG91320.1 Conserved hypothetical protein [Ramlibacter tataouinensis TTB310]
MSALWPNTKAEPPAEPAGGSANSSTFDSKPAVEPALADWARRPERSNMLALRFMAWVSLRLGRRAARSLLHAVALYFLLFAPAARRASAEWLRRVRGPHAPAPGWRDLHRHFVAFASVVHDRVFLVNDQCELFDVEMHNEAFTRELRERGRGLMLMGAHMGSFEVLRALGRRTPGLRVAMAMYKENAQKINQLLSAINPSAEMDVVALGQMDSMLQLHALLDSGNTIVGMMGDRVLGAEATREIMFLGQPAHFPLGPFRMAAILRRPVIFVVGLYGGGNRYDLHFEKLADFSEVPPGGRQAQMEAAMDRYVMLLEKYARLAPYNWFNFYDFWRQQVPGARP